MGRVNYIASARTSAHLCSTLRAPRLARSNSHNFSVCFTLNSEITPSWATNLDLLHCTTLYTSNSIFTFLYPLKFRISTHFHDASLLLSPPTILRNGLTHYHPLSLVLHELFQSLTTIHDAHNIIHDIVSSFSSSFLQPWPSLRLPPTPPSCSYPQNQLNNTPLPPLRMNIGSLLLKATTPRT